jgi:signal transduction histidine kinase
MHAAREISPLWRKHLNLRGYVAYVLLCVVLSAAVGYGFYHSNLGWFRINKGEEKTSALQLVNAFVTTYSDVRKQYLSGDAPVPATYRAHAIDKFNETRGANGSLRLSMVGVPGREIVTPPSDKAMADAIRQFLVEANPQPRTEFLETQSETVLRTVYPSIASQQSCVDCHNKLQPSKQQWSVNDVMGAFVAEVPASGFLMQARRDAALTAALVLLAAIGVGSYVFGMHAKQLARRAESEARLSAAHEDLKAAVDKLALQERLAAIGQMAGTVSHELRNPLGVIQSSIGVIRSVTANKQLGIERPLDRIDRSIERCSKIIGELLGFARTGELNRDHFEVDQLVGGILDGYSQPSGIEIHRSLESGATAAIDAHRFEQVITNLLDNACHALADAHRKDGDARENRIFVSTETAGPHVRVTVQDTGPGIPSEVLPKIFEPLFTTKSFGTGLGLPTVRRFVEQHGGTIDVASIPGRGTTFTIYLPRLEIARSKDMPAAVVAAQRLVSVGVLQPMGES